MTRARSQASPPACLAAALALVLAAPSGTVAQSDHELLHTCLDTFEGRKRAGRTFTREYARHVLYCNFTVDILDEAGRRRAAYERWRTERYHQELARLDERADGSGSARASRRDAVGEELVTEESVRYAECLRDRADALVADRPEIADDPDALRREAGIVVAECALQAGTR